MDLKGILPFLLITLTILTTSCATSDLVPWIPEPKDENPFFPIKKNEKWGYIDKTGNVVIEPRFSGASRFSEGLARISVDMKFGFVDKSGKVIVKPRYDIAYDFSEGRALIGNVVRVNEDAWYIEWGYIDKTGKEVIEPRFMFGALLHPVLRHFSEGLAPVEVGGRFKLDEDQLPLASTPGKWGYIDRKGKIVIKPWFDEASPFSEGLAAVEIDGKWGFVNQKGEIVIKPQFCWPESFSDGLAKVRFDFGSAWGYIDRRGKIVIKPQFENAHEFSEGLAAVCIEGKWGYIDKTGSLVIQSRDELEFKEADIFSEGLAAVKIQKFVPEHGLFFPVGDMQWGYINSTGKIVIEPRFDEAGRFSDGLAVVVIDNKYGYIDKTGKYVWEPTE